MTISQSRQFILEKMGLQKDARQRALSYAGGWPFPTESYDGLNTGHSQPVCENNDPGLPQDVLNIYDGHGYLVQRIDVS